MAPPEALVAPAKINFVREPKARLAGSQLRFSCSACSRLRRTAYSALKRHLVSRKSNLFVALATIFLS